MEGLVQPDRAEDLEQGGQPEHRGGEERKLRKVDA